MLLLLWAAAAAILRLVARREELRIARQIGLRIAGAERRLLVRRGHAAHVLVALIAEVIAQIRSTTLGPEERRVLPELLLGDGDQAQVMLGVLVVILRRDGIAGRLRVARQLDVFLGDMRRVCRGF